MPRGGPHTRRGPAPRSGARTALAAALATTAALVGIAAVAGCRGAGPSTPPLVVPASSSTSRPVLTSRLRPSNDRDWPDDLALLARAEIDGNRVTLRNIRNFEWHTDTAGTPRWYDKTFDLDALRTVDFVVVPFLENAALAHTMLSFGFSTGEYVTISVEVRAEREEPYSAAAGFFRQYELIYLVADERDVIRLRTEHRLCDVYLYPTTAPPEKVRELFLDMLARVNELAERPEFYDTLTNNCTTNLWQHVNRIAPGRVPYGTQILLPGLSDQLAYDLGLLQSRGSFAATKAQAWVNARAYKHRSDPDFSLKIRGL